ncbi:hypothetical protein A9W98_10605 [Mycobacterium gordonae]|uniref:Uncharacterized protein n=1 Tax=Mycobacterium gordonae TaxID=1778 RepID=A0A1A6BER0_MYCGO|nr:hypothetical protein [Mycobacterium gordonae]OBR98068.1 hypothetical protein A9W98_04185 [Mycobacterium gordonae]OBR98227.1 hypothetical protein A9W98_03345 [Mycobacterium gordonae]OBR99932.1 hypothetical protein A9W98_27710 [Mycobacterium gordonae]OBS00810.1 hypothetical protein A9W98_23130 [Mycobacterium gordonae]OBS02852.1 hypothetical protein A9W98_01105 [Mycobacterium gordonae]
MQGDVVGAVAIGIPGQLNSRRAVAQPWIDVDRDVVYRPVGQDVVHRFGRPEFERGREIEDVDDRAKIEIVEMGGPGDDVRPAPELLMPKRTDQGLGDLIGQFADGVAILDADAQRHHIGHHARSLFQGRSRARRDRQRHGDILSPGGFRDEHCHRRDNPGDIELVVLRKMPARQFAHLRVAGCQRRPRPAQVGDIDGTAQDVLPILGIGVAA